MRVREVTAALAALFVLAACSEAGDRAGAAGGNARRVLRVVTTVAPITSIVASIAGDRARVDGLVPEGTNSHTFEPRPSAARLLSQADIVFVNGLVLEEPTKRLALASGRPGFTFVEIGPRVLSERDYIYDFSFPRSEGKPNPHLWTDPTYGRRYADVVRDVLTARDPANAAYYSGRHATFVSAVDAFDRALRRVLESVPREQRKLLTYHDAYAYFARTYGWRVIGAIQVSDFEDPTAREVARLIAQVRREKVRAIFGSEVFPSPVLARVGKETGARYVDVLRDDDLPGAPGDADHSWLGLLRFDYATVVGALGGDASGLRGLRLDGATDDSAHYPQ